jgi:hypothetical protein
MPYRTSMEKPTADQISEFVSYDSPCPYCESSKKAEFYTKDNPTGQASKWVWKELVKRRGWSFLWWKKHPAYYRRKCAQCKESYKELLPIPDQKF